MIWHSLPASWCCRWWTFTGSWGELGWGTREHHETSQNIVKSWRNQSLQRYHMISWYILKHHETSWHLFQYSLFFLIVQGCHHNQLTFWDGRIRVESEGQIYHDMSWNIMKHHEPYFSIFQLFLIFSMVQGCHYNQLAHFRPQRSLKLQKSSAGNLELKECQETRYTRYVNWNDSAFSRVRSNTFFPCKNYILCCRLMMIDVGCSLVPG